VVADMSVGSNSIVVNAYVVGNYGGVGTLATSVDLQYETVYGPTQEVSMVLPLMD
jgi:hypothetical protein